MRLPDMIFKTRTLATALSLLLLMLMLLIGLRPDPVRANTQIWGADYFPNYELTSHSGETLRFYDDVIADKVVAISFMFTGCTDICPVETARLVDVYRLLGERVGNDVHFYSITIDPDNDTPQVLAEYARRFGIDGSRWKFLTGEKLVIDGIRDRFGVLNSAAEEQDLANHDINLVLGNQATGQWVKRSPFESPYVLANQLGSWLHGGRYKSTFTAGDFAAAPQLRQISSGEMMFRDRCSSCHIINGGLAPMRNAPVLGPDLFAVSERRNSDWLKRWLAEPDKMLEEGDPIATALDAQFPVSMPNLGLDSADIDALMSYMAIETDRLRRVANNKRQTEHHSSNSSHKHAVVVTPEHAEDHHNHDSDHHGHNHEHNK